MATTVLIEIGRLRVGGLMLRIIPGLHVDDHLALRVSRFPDLVGAFHIVEGEPYRDR